MLKKAEVAEKVKQYFFLEILKIKYKKIGPTWSGPNELNPKGDSWESNLDEEWV